MIIPGRRPGFRSAHGDFNLGPSRYLIYGQSLSQTATLPFRLGRILPKYLIWGLNFGEILPKIPKISQVLGTRSGKILYTFPSTSTDLGKLGHTLTAGNNGFARLDLPCFLMVAEDWSGIPRETKLWILRFTPRNALRYTLITVDSKKYPHPTN